MKRAPGVEDQAGDVEPLPHAPPAELQQAQAERLMRVWATPTGLRYWSAVNNTEVGIWYTALSFVFFLFAGGLALMMQAQTWPPTTPRSSSDGPRARP